MPDQSLPSLLRNLSPRLNEGEYVFCIDDRNMVSETSALGVFQERDGRSVVLPKQQALSLGLNFEVALAWITLDVSSSLQAVGLTAQVSSALADQGIACNVVAGFHHDHLFVPVADASRAMTVLSELANSDFDLAKGVANAHQRIANSVLQTRLMHSEAYSRKTGANIYFKCENLQTTGSFKLRGAFNKFLSLDHESRERGVVAASTGNHGRGVAYAAKKLRSRCTIFAPMDADQNKLDAMAALGAIIEQVGADCVETEKAARRAAEESGRCYISPYNDPVVVAGQGTIGIELCHQLKKIDAVIAATGGGGLISGIASAVKPQHPDCMHIACSPANSDVMIQSLKANRILDISSRPTLSDATAGGVESDSVTFDFCRRYVDRGITIEESDIARCLTQFMDTHGMLIEGAAAVAIAAMEKVAAEYQGKNIVVILCGGNIGSAKLASIL